MAVSIFQPGVILIISLLRTCISWPLSLLIFPDSFTLIGKLKHDNLGFTIKGPTAGAEEIEPSVSLSS